MDQIYGYCHKITVAPGDTIYFHVSCPRGAFYIRLYRYGAQNLRVYASDLLKGQAALPGDSGENWDWPVYPVTISEHWSPGVYIAHFVEDLTPQNFSDHPDGRYGKALFIIRARRSPATILYKLPLFTYLAYNRALPGDKCLYRDNNSRVSLQKPGGGTGGTPWDMKEFPDPYDDDSPRQTFAHWDAKFVVWLETNGFQVDYCTDLDVHQNKEEFLFDYQLLICAGHDEYWSEEMRKNVERFIQKRRNVAFFSGNTCWWRVHLLEKETVVFCDKRSMNGSGASVDHWSRVDPENGLTGLSFRNGGGLWTGGRERLGYTVQHTDHWVFAGTGLRDGDSFGSEEHLIGYECDGLDMIEQVLDGRRYFKSTGRDGAPDNFRILGIARLDKSWDDFHDKNFFPPSGGLNSIMGMYENRGTVFVAATTDWVRVLAAGDRIVGIITCNVVERLSQHVGEKPAVSGF